MADFQHPSLTRRTLLQAGSIGLLGLGTDHIDRLRAEAAARGAVGPRARSVIFIFLSGGLRNTTVSIRSPRPPPRFAVNSQPLRRRRPASGFASIYRSSPLGVRSGPWCGA